MRPAEKKTQNYFCQDTCFLLPAVVVQVVVRLGLYRSQDEDRGATLHRVDELLVYGIRW